MNINDKTALPSLSTDGWISEITAKCDYLLAHFYASEITQTHFFPNKVCSIVNLVQENNHDPLTLGIRVRESLTSYLSAYFSSVDIQTSCTEEKDKPGIWAIHIYCVVGNDRGDKYNLANIVQYEGSKIMKISRINDGQSAI